MAEQERKTRHATGPGKQDDAPAPSARIAEKGTVIKKSLDKVLDEIDSVLEENAEEFVKGYVQRGGE